MSIPTQPRTPTWVRRTKASALVGAVAVGGALALSGLTATPAEASGFGCTATTPIRIPKTWLSPANWCGGPVGSGRTVESVNASFASSIVGVGYFCDTSMKVEIFNDHGQNVWTGYSETTPGCFQAGGAFDMYVGKTLSTDGYVETSLLSYGATIATVSHNIHS